MADLSSLSDAELWRRTTASIDGDAFQTLMARHRPLVWSVCARMLRNANDAEDAFQMTFLALLEQGAAIKSADFGAWLYRVAYRASLRVQANRVSVSGTATRDLNTIAESSMDTDVFREIEQAEQTQLIEEALDSLPERYREVLVLHYCRGIARDEIAARLGLTPQTVKARLSRGRVALRSRLVRRGLSLSLAALLLGSKGQAAPRGVEAPADLDAHTWQLAKKWLSGDPVSLEMAQFSDFPTTEYGMKSLNGLNVKWSVVAVAAVAGLFLVFEAGRANGANGAVVQSAAGSPELARLKSEGTRIEIADADEQVRTELVPASHSVAKPVVVQQAATPELASPAPVTSRPAATQNQSVASAAYAPPPTTTPLTGFPLQRAAITQASRHPGLPNGTWTRRSALGEVSIIVDGGKIEIEFVGDGEVAALSGSAMGEYSVASDGTIYGLLHSIDAAGAAMAAEDAEAAAMLGMLNDLPFSMRVHSDTGVMAVKSLTIGIPMMGSLGDIGEAGSTLGVHFCGTYRSPNDRQARGPAYPPRRSTPLQQLSYPPAQGYYPAVPTATPLPNAVPFGTPTQSYPQAQPGGDIPAAAMQSFRTHGGIQ